MKELDQLRVTQSRYIKELDCLPKLSVWELLRQCYYGSLGGILNTDGRTINNITFNTYINDRSVEVKIYIQHPEDWNRQFVIQHYTKSANGDLTYHAKTQSGKWDKHLLDAVEVIRQGQIKYVQGKLADIDKRIDELVNQLDKEKAEFEMLFD